MEYAVLGRAEEGPQLRLDYREFSYAGKFVMSNTGKAVVRDPDAESGESVETGEATDPNPDLDRDWIADDRIVAAVAFNEDRTDPGVLWLRYVTVHESHRGAGHGARLAAFVTKRAEQRGYRRLRIAVNNPYAYDALYKAGFVYTGRETGMAELVLERPGPRDRATYQCGLDVYRDRDLSADEERFLARKEGREPPALVEAPIAADPALDAADVPETLASGGDAGRSPPDDVAEELGFGDSADTLDFEDPADRPGDDPESDV